MTTVEAKPEARAKAPQATLEGRWSIDDAAEIYQTRLWGKGFFDINAKGHVVVRPTRVLGHEVDLFDVVAGMRERGLNTPVLLHFSDLLERRMRDMREAFDAAIAENGYKGSYTGVYPIKVNQQRRVVEEVRRYGVALDFGLEVGSKPELLAVMGMTTDSPDRLIICNGFKEQKYIEFVTLAAKLGRNIIPVIENMGELKLIVECANRLGVRPKIGVRMNLSTPGAGRWRHSSGVKAKFGLSLTEVIETVDFLKAREMADCLQLLHCHMGSQIHDIRQVNSGVNELARIYVQLVKMGAGLRILDVGGGMGIDYDGSQTAFEFSTNYSLVEYANSVVYKTMSVCDEESVAHPIIVTESGRAMVAQQSVLIFDVLGCNRPDRAPPPAELPAVVAPEEELPRPLVDLWELHRSISERRILEQYHDALEARDEAMRLFSVGYLTLEHRAIIDRLFWSICAKIRDKARSMGAHTPEELTDLDATLTDTYFCNLSVFQSLPDIWAINQLFPIMPIHRLDERPTRNATLADITCDSDGKVDRFVDDHDIKKFVELHEFTEGTTYLLGAFLVGAYQETLGDLHNLFGDTHVAHIKLDANGQWWIDEIIEGDSISEVLKYVQFDAVQLGAQIRRECERSVRKKQLSPKESKVYMKMYEDGLAGYTYLEPGRGNGEG
ncbi:MAG: biosynthetic arginine decarboxylase [Phycisphaerales bacterium]|nr:biosynthetic arginine decarboxylase [Phycisphaerales bacterium]